MPNVISFLIAHSWTLFKIFLREILPGAIKTISSAKRPPQHFFPLTLTPYWRHLSSTSLIKIKNKIGDNGQPCRTPRLIGNSSERHPLWEARAFEVRYRFLRNWRQVHVFQYYIVLWEYYRLVQSRRLFWDQGMSNMWIYL